MKVAIVDTLKQYCRTTTLHGFKYLYSSYCIDRIIWLVWSFTIAGCAGVLCAVLWERFQKIPSLLIVGDAGSEMFPSVVVCPSPERTGNLLSEKLSLNQENSRFMSLLFAIILNRKIPKLESLVKLDRVLSKNNVTLREGLLRSVPGCDQMLKRCRWQNYEIECNQLFTKEMTEWGVCCVARPLNKSEIITNQNQLDVNQQMNLVLDCYLEDLPQACQFLWAFYREPYHQPILLSSHQAYVGQIKFTSIIDTHESALIDGSCNQLEEYSKVRCLTVCKENQCGCASPFRYNFYEKSHLPPCSGTQLHCILQFSDDHNTCECANPCETIRSQITLERNALCQPNYAYDPLFSNLNVTRPTILTVVVKAKESKVLYSKPTETWITLISSLGGIFNMFLGVGFFSALEVLFYLIIKLPITIRRYAEIQPGK